MRKIEGKKANTDLMANFVTLTSSRMINMDQVVDVRFASGNAVLTVAAQAGPDKLAVIHVAANETDQLQEWLARNSFNA